MGGIDEMFWTDILSECDKNGDGKVIINNYFRCYK